jgi:hypothetical protein
MNRFVRLVPKFPNGCISDSETHIFRTTWFSSHGRGEREGLSSACGRPFLWQGFGSHKLWLSQYFEQGAHTVGWKQSL